MYLIILIQTNSSIRITILGKYIIVNTRRLEIRIMLKKIKYFSIAYILTTYKINLLKKLYSTYKNLKLNIKI